MLPVIWLLGHEPRLADIEEPETNVLRKAGMFEIGSDMFHRIDSRMNHRTRKAKGYEAVDPNDLGDELSSKYRTTVLFWQTYIFCSGMD